MGLRYYAYQVEPHFIGLARHDPSFFVSAESPAGGDGRSGGAIVDLDKRRRQLHRLTTDGAEPRPSSRLFEGDVRHCGDDASRVPCIRVLEPDEVSRIAADLVLLGERDVRSMFRSEEVASVAEFLIRVQHFAVDAARAGNGIIYLIG
ncbi:hypothetical protein BHE97_17515 [Aeromicrobium sp. PE09-221]|uniref:hypothetical protein n=1 Tax=Aeromicrobium sp. PE09-221 TaxID=1898043 RepID=UPI000B3EDF89|nr:hypothetical protein [Aeromicrobium sp. PE09-221]OUZ07299.1 hypothetical protein BHE97_17515 [Aeromicrobium sp. PE09-221]